MRSIYSFTALLVCGLSTLMLTSCAQRAAVNTASNTNMTVAETKPAPDYKSRLPSHIATKEKMVLIDPRVHVWGAYDSSGNLVRAGLASAGSNWCPDIKRACHTRPGSFRVSSLGNANCKSSIYPLPKGGAPMPYCMFFNKNQGMHGSARGNVVEGNVSHGCVRMHVEDAQWLRFNFVNVGTKVVVRPYY